VDEPGVACGRRSRSASRPPAASWPGGATSPTPKLTVNTLAWARRSWWRS